MALLGVVAIVAAFGMIATTYPIENQAFAQRQDRIYMYICTDYKYAFENAIGEART